MTKIDILTLGDNRTNCYLVWEARFKSCLVIDPGYEPETVLSRVEELGLTVEAIALTHGHFDHVGGVAEIVAQTHCPVWIKEADYAKYRDPLRAFLFPLGNKNVPVSFYQNTLSAAGLSFTVYDTPGHTYGSVCLQCGDALFTGDTLFHGAYGRTDLPGGDKDAMEKSLKFLYNLVYSGEFYPGHGSGGDFSFEKRTNAYLRGDI